MYDNHSHFTQTDPKRGDLSEPLKTLTYGYTSGDPANRSDAAGQEWYDAIGWVGDFGEYWYYLQAGDTISAQNKAESILVGVGANAVCSTATAPANAGIVTAAPVQATCYGISSVTAEGYFYMAESIDSYFYG